MKHKVIVVGAGMGGLAAAADLARAGKEVIVLDKAEAPGGKMRRVKIGNSAIDAGPTVFTMRWIFDGLFGDAGQSLDDHVTIKPATLLARHGWTKGGRLDLFADIEASVDAIADFAGPADAEGYRRFCRRSAEIYATLKDSFIAGQSTSPIGLASRVGLGRIGDLLRTAPTKSLWKALDGYFRDPRLRQLFGRYATYVGSSPLKAPSTMMLIAHVEQDGVWRIEGGIHDLARAVMQLGERQGAVYRFGCPVARLVIDRGRVRGVDLENGERIAADSVVFNGDVGALAAGLLGADASPAADAPTRQQRSLSAVTWCLRAKTGGFPLSHHSVFFAENYPREFDAVFNRRTVTEEPTVYICAQDREADVDVGDVPEKERLLMLINAPPDGDLSRNGIPPVDRLQERTLALLGRCGLTVDVDQDDAVITGPGGFNALFPGTGGALYGRANHGSMTSFSRPGALSRIGGLYLAGGSVHPGPGIPMATMSGRLAAARILQKE